LQNEVLTMGRVTDGRQTANEPATTPGSAREAREREAHRMVAADLFDAGVRQADVARRLGISHQAVSRWHARWESGGREALLARVAGRRPRLGWAPTAGSERSPSGTAPRD
jgi:transposase-like protein